jgi:anti-sigma-K factor RskA
MRYTDPKLRELLAAEYVVGTLRGRARERFRSLLRYDSALRREVADWEARLDPLVEAMPARTPPATAWAGIEARLGLQAATAGQAAPDRSKGAASAPDWWNAVALTISSLALALLLRAGSDVTSPPATVANAPGQAQPAPGMMAILTDATAQPTMLVSWPMEAGSDGTVELRVRIIMDHPTMDASTSWELWLMPADPGGPPRSVGLIGIEPEQRLRVDASMLKALLGAAGMALSNEPAGGSPTGAPSGPVIFRGPCIKT